MEGPAGSQTYPVPKLGGVESRIRPNGVGLKTKFPAAVGHL